MGAGGFQARPDAIHRLAARFAAEAAEVHGRIEGFESTVRDVSDAFGWLGPSEEMYRDYQRSVGEAAESLGAVAALLADAAERLAATADNYAASDATLAP